MGNDNVRRMPLRRTVKARQIIKGKKRLRVIVAVLTVGAFVLYHLYDALWSWRVNH